MVKMKIQICFFSIAHQNSKDDDENEMSLIF